MRGGKRKGAGRKPSPDPMKKKQVILRQDQIDFLKGLPRYKSSQFVRDAIDERRIKMETFEHSHGESQLQRYQLNSEIELHIYHFEGKIITITEVNSNNTVEACYYF